jgi:ubiquinone/menaquinone biosynthesis C-methylase UbiE
MPHQRPGAPSRSSCNNSLFLPCDYTDWSVSTLNTMELNMQTMTLELEQLIGKVIGDVGGTANATLVVVGDRLGLYKALAEMGPVNPDELAVATGTHERYVREWLATQAASGYVTYDPATERFSMTAEQTLVLADENSPVYMVGGFYAAASVSRDEEHLAEAFRSGRGMAWGDHHDCLFCGTEKFFRPSYVSNLVQNWIPSLRNVVPVLEAGATIADLGCGHGCSTLIMAKAYPNSRVIGFDYHAQSIQHARWLAEEEGVENVEFEVGTAQDFPGVDGGGYDLVTIFDALHDMGDPVGAARRVRETLRPDGTWMIVEPAAGDRLEENLNPVGRVYYAMSTAVCVPSALSQNGGEAMGAQAGAAVLKRVLTDGGFSSIRVATRSPFNMVIEVRN